MKIDEAYALVLLDSTTAQNDGEIVTLSCYKDRLGVVTNALYLQGIHYTPAVRGDNYDIHIKLEDAAKIPGLAPRVFPETATIPVDVQYQVIEDWLATALEGGSNYWYYLKDLHMLEGNRRTTPVAELIARQCWEGDVTIPVWDIEGDATDEPLGFISRDTLERGCKLYTEQYEGDMSDDACGDADDADTWFQLVVLGEIQFG